MLGLLIVAFFVVVALLAPFLAHPTQRNPYLIPHEGYASDPRPPSPGHPFGTTEEQFDLYYGVIWGARTAFVVALTVVASAVAVALLLGSLSGFYGGWIDEIVMRVTDIFLAFPGLILAVVIVAVLGQNVRNAVIAIAAVEWPTYTRLLRGEFLRVRDMEYVQAAQALGRAPELHYLMYSRLDPSLRQAMTPGRGVRAVVPGLDVANVLASAVPIAHRVRSARARFVCTAVASHGFGAVLCRRPYGCWVGTIPVLRHLGFTRLRFVPAVLKTGGEAHRNR